MGFRHTPPVSRRTRHRFGHTSHFTRDAFHARHHRRKRPAPPLPSPRMNARHESILNHAGSRWLWISVALSAVSLLAYALHSPAVPPNGGTWLGYTLGTIAGLLILWLMFFGVRKRSYSGTSNLRGWLSAHVY